MLPRLDYRELSMTSPLDRLLAIMARLRDPERGCPWDRVQDFSTIAPYTIEEAYEVADAIARSDRTALKDELGDLLFQVVFHARMAEEAQLFAFDDVAAAIADKMLRRHPHVFGNAEIASRGTERGLGGTQGRRAAAPRASGGNAGKRPRRRRPRPARAAARGKDPAAGGADRLRLARPQAGHGKSPRGGRRTQDGERDGLGTHRAGRRGRR